MGVGPKTSDTVIRPDEVSTLMSLSTHEPDLLANNLYGIIAGNQRTAFAFSRPTLVVR